MELEGKVAVILGASSGIGEGIAEAFAEKKVRGLVLAARREDRLEGLAGRIRESYGVDTLVVGTDVTNYESVGNLVERTVEKYGGLDVFVNSAGVIQKETFVEEMEPGKIDGVVGTNLIGVLYSMKYAVPRILEGGVFIAISSMAGKNAYANEESYCGSKAGVDHAVRCLDTRIRGESGRAYAFSIGPGFIDTEEARRQFPDVPLDVWEKAPNALEFGRVVVEYAVDSEKKYVEKGAVHHLDTVNY